MQTATPERWAAIPGYPHYEASDQGNVRSYYRNRYISPTPSMLRAGENGQGYRVVNLKHETGVKAPVAVHVLVLLTFVGPRPYPRAHGRHLNDSKRDNRLCNLAWGSSRENAFDCSKNGRGCSRLTEAQAIEALKSLANGESNRAIAQRLGVNDVVIHHLKAGRTWAYLPRPQSMPKVKHRLSAEKVTAIRAASGTLQQIAGLYGVSITTVHNIRAGKAHRQQGHE